MAGIASAEYLIRVLTYGEIDRTEWSRLVRESRTGTWFQSPEAYDFFATQSEVMEPFAIGVTRTPECDSGLMNEGMLRGVCVGYVTKELSRVKQFFTRRAIISGGPALADDATNEEAETLMDGVRQRLVNGNRRLVNAPIYIETRHFNDYSLWKSAFENAGFAYRKHLNFHIDCSDKDAMWRRLSETRRRQIRKAQKSGAEIVEAQSEREVEAWYRILAELYRTRVKTPLWSLPFFLQFYRQGVGKYLLVKHAGKVIGGIMIVCKEMPVTDDGTRDENGCVYEWYICGMDADYKEQCPSVMATWAAMEYAEKHDIARFDVMGAGEPDVPYGVRDFKAEFGGQLVEHGRFIHVANKTLYRIGKWGVRMLRR